MVIEPQDGRSFEIGESTARFDQIDGLHIDVADGHDTISISPEAFEELAREAGFVPADEQ